MDSVRAIHLAADVLKDHFGDVVERVGLVLMERGPLSVQDVLRFGGLPSCTGTDSMLIEPLTFQQVRNALLTLVQHGVVRTKPRVEVASSDSVRSMLQVYSLDKEEVFARMRFPHFLEYVRATYGDVGQELLFTALKYGRVAASIIKTETREALGNVSAAEIEEELKRLLEDRVLNVVSPFGSAVGGPVAVAASPVAASAAASSRAPQLQSGGSSPSSAKAGAEPRKRKTPDEDQQVVASDSGDALKRIKESVYRYDRGTLNLCMCKSLICRVVEERVNGHAAQVLTTILTAVQPGDGSADRPAESRGVSIQYMSLEAVEQKMKDLGHHQPGRDPEREREKLKKVLDLLSAHKDSLVSRRRVAGPPSNTKTAEKGSGGNAADAVRRIVEGAQVEWAVDWHSARRLLLSSTMSQLIRDQFGPFGLRIFNLLNERNPPQKLEEKDIFSICMVPPEEGREVLNAMVQRCVVSWQEVPRSANTPLSASYWLYYVDRRRVELSMLQSVLQAALNLRVRFAAESAAVEPLESRRDSLSARERAALNEGRRIEDILERSFLVLDAAVLVFTSF